MTGQHLFFSPSSICLRATLMRGRPGYIRRYVLLASHIRVVCAYHALCISTASRYSLCTIYAVPCALYHVRCIMCAVSCALYHVRCIMCAVSCALYYLVPPRATADTGPTRRAYLRPLRGVGNTTRDNPGVVGVSRKVKISPPTMLKHHGRDNYP